MNAMLDQFARTADRIKREMVDAQSEQYELDDAEPWTPVLRRLPFSCVVWERYRTFDQARRRHAAEMEKQTRWRRELGDLGQMLVDQADPDSSDDETWSRAYLRGRRLEQAIKDPHGLLDEAKTVAEQAAKVWGRTWEVRQALEAERMRIMAMPADNSGGVNPKAEALRDLAARLQQYEAPRG